MPRQRKIKVTLTTKKKPWCYPEKRGADFEDTLVFWSPTHHFTIHFGTKSPGTVITVTGEPDHPVSIPVTYNPANAGAQTFKYTAAIWDPDEEEKTEEGEKKKIGAVKIIDPEIIIPPLTG